MIPNKGQYVKIIFRNSTHVEGFVDEWSNTKVILKAEDGDSYLIIMNLEADALAVKVSNKKDLNSMTIDKINLEEKFKEVYEQPSANNDLRIKSLAKLRIALAEQEKKIVADKVVNHVPLQHNPGVKYGNIFIKK